MPETPYPKHYVFAKWFVRLRWIAVFFLVSVTIFVRHVLNIPIREVPIYILALLLLFINAGFGIFLRSAGIKKDPDLLLPKIKRNIHIQISTDLFFLTFMLHFSGGVENPLIIYYIFHMIIAALIFRPVESYAHTGFALLLVASMAFLECFSVIPHYGLRGFIPANFYQNTQYLLGSGFIFLTTSLMVVTLINMIIARSIRNEEAYIRANQELEKKDKLKNEYVLRVTHDIKGHLAAISSCLKVVSSGIFGKLNEKQEEFVNRAYDRTEILTSFVRDLLNLTKKRLSGENISGEFSLKELLQKVAESVRINARDKHIEFEFFMDNGITMMEGDPYSIEEMFSNLVLNAIKYTPEKGHVELNVRSRPDAVVAEISDNGIGIPEKDLPRIFDEFFRAGNVAKDGKTGSGLGLSLVKQIVDNHNGRITVKSDEGLGTKFTVTLPLKQQAKTLSKKKNTLKKAAWFHVKT